MFAMPTFTRLSRSMLWLAPILATATAILCYGSGLPGKPSLCALVAMLCALWWIFECLNIAIVGLLPFVAFPLLGILSHSEVAKSYGNTTILLLMGGFFLSAAMERSGAHRRVAVTMVRAVGGRGGKRLVLGFMLATALLSMWISNAATTLMMLPIALAVLAQVNDATLRTPLLLGIAYAASVGGMATPIGTPPNVIFVSMIKQNFDVTINFLDWMMYGLPITVILLPIIWWWLTRSMKDTGIVEMPEVGRWRSSELRVMGVFFVTALLWIFRASPYGGWSALLPEGKSMIGDATIALGASMCLFIMPAGEKLTKPDADKETDVSAHEAPPVERLLDWPSAVKIPWGILIMFGGGLALADGFMVTGLSEVIGGKLSVFADAPAWCVVLAVCVLVSLLTELTSSTATATLLLPILGSLALATGVEPATIMIPGTISCSCAFMLPVATAPNVIVFGAGGIRTDEMARCGLVLNLFAAIVITMVALVVSGA